MTQHNGMTIDEQTHFFKRLLADIHAPDTEANLKALRAWRDCEGSNAQFNPLDTTLWRTGAYPYNTFYVNGRAMHVWNYSRLHDGVKATAETLLEDYYTHIVEALRAGHGHIVSGKAREQMHTWGTNADCIHHRLTSA